MPLLILFFLPIGFLIFMAGLTGTLAIVTFAKLTFFGAWCVGVVLCFRASVMVGVMSLIVVPLPIIIGAISMVEQKNVARDFHDFLIRP